MTSWTGKTPNAPRAAALSDAASAAAAFVTSSTIPVAIAPLGISTFFSSMEWSLAVKRCPPLASSAATDQYSCARNARISRSRSTMSRSATVCTRPADSPFFTVFQSSGDAL
ncbi:MAG: hypothetical protein IPF87_02780 [Gemmatimonadetes bacterium]|nr:hypothetical protein [Gemmatimonadota bacterium]